MRNLMAAAIFLTTALISAPAPAQEACEYYRVQQGDSLQEINRRAYGDDNFRRIYNENRREIGRNPNIIEIGLVLKLPCLDGRLPATSALPPGEAEVSLVTANGYLPYTDESLTNQGLMSQLVATAMARAVPERRFEIVFVNDWSAHLEELLPRQAFDASFPWTQPDCQTVSSNEECEAFLYSDPFYEIVEGFFSRNGSGLESVIDASAFEGTTICRPEGYPTGHLSELGLVAPKVSLVRPVDAYACFDMLMAGRADLVSLDTRAADHVLGDLGLTFDVAENRHLFSIQPLRVALHKDNPGSQQLVGDLNRGLAIMLESGEWTSIVTEALADQPGPLTN